MFNPAASKGTRLQSANYSPARSGAGYNKRGLNATGPFLGPLLWSPPRSGGPPEMGVVGGPAGGGQAIGPPGL